MTRKHVEIRKEIRMKNMLFADEGLVNALREVEVVRVHNRTKK